MSDPDASVQLATELSALLAGKELDVVGAAIADLVGMWLAQHPRKTWPQVLRLHMKTARLLAEVNLGILEAQRKQGHH